jgi:hypothetical protein
MEHPVPDFHPSRDEKARPLGEAGFVGLIKGERKADWDKRKQAYVVHLDTADEDVLRVSLADKVHNARAILRDLRTPEVGESIWARFNQPREKTLWYYRSLADKFRERLPGQLANELSGYRWRKRTA